MNKSSLRIRRPSLCCASITGRWEGGCAHCRAVRIAPVPPPFPLKFCTPNPTGEGWPGAWVRRKGWLSGKRGVGALNFLLLPSENVYRRHGDMPAGGRSPEMLVRP
jgi:hypothetical protein